MIIVIIFLGGFLTRKYMELFSGLVILLSLKRVKCLSVQEFAWIVVSGFHNFSMINKLILLFPHDFCFHCSSSLHSLLCTVESIIA
jgi:hypothetical protein